MDWKQEILKRLDVLAEKLGTTAQYLWSVLVKQGTIEGISDIFVGVIFLIGLIIGIKLLKFCIKEGPKHRSEKCNDWQGPYIFGSFVGTVMIIAGTIGFTTWIYYGLQALLNPEYYALQKLIELFK
jgi:hypothetical protein